MTAHQFIAFGGWLYPISKWLPAFARHYSAPLLGFSSSWCRSFALQIDRPTILVGFSEGANAVLQVAGHSPQVRQAIVHSCERKRITANRGCHYRLFATEGDTTPTYRGTHQTFDDLAEAGASVVIQDLPFVPFANPTFFESRQLARRKHIFHNVLPHIDRTLKGLDHVFA